MNETIGAFLALGGSVFLMLASIGMLRMPDYYNRMQTGTKATTLGSILFLVGVGVMRPEWLGKMLLLVGFVVLTNPVSSHALARAAHNARERLDKVGKTVLAVDALADAEAAEAAAAAAGTAPAAGNGEASHA
ncbi:MAG TPA: monovalent cation/H(+) antiporter subunit G [Spirochaetales bacterium]|nr:monovalent cation/H(+) antiporter subunit G [Spirochaetales bacterium]